MAICEAPLSRLQLLYCHELLDLVLAQGTIPEAEVVCHAYEVVSQRDDWHLMTRHLADLSWMLEMRHFELFDADEVSCGQIVYTEFLHPIHIKCSSLLPLYLLGQVLVCTHTIIRHAYIDSEREVAPFVDL